MKRGFSFTFVFVLSMMLCASFVSAGFFGNLFSNGVTGHAISDSVDSNCVQSCLDDKCLQYTRKAVRAWCMNKFQAECENECSGNNEINNPSPVVQSSTCGKRGNCILYEGETVDWKNFDISINYVSTAEVVFQINDLITNSLSEGDSYSDSEEGFKISVKKINVRDYVGYVSSVIFQMEDYEAPVFECYDNDDCPTTSETFCNDEGQRCVQSTIYSCVNNSCLEVGGSAGCGNCSLGAVCSDGECVPETPECTSDDDCFPAHCSPEGRCVECVTTQHCLDYGMNDYHCYDYGCVSAQYPCDSNDDCDAGEVCSDGECVSETSDLERFKFETDSNRLNLNEGIYDVIPRAVVNEDMPTLLRDNLFFDVDGKSYDYIQEVQHSNLIFSNFSDNDYNNGEWTLGFEIENFDLLLDYSLEFVNSLPLEFLKGRHIEILGEDYFINYAKDYGSYQQINLLGPAVKGNLNEGDSEVITLDENEYVVSIDSVNSSYVSFIVNGIETNDLREGHVQRLVSGDYISPEKILLLDRENFSVDYSIGRQKIELGNGLDIKRNGERVNGLKSKMVFTPLDKNLSSITLEWRADDDEFITVAQDLYFPVFESFYFDLESINYTARPIAANFYLVKTPEDSGKGSVPSEGKPEPQGAVIWKIRNVFRNIFGGRR